MHVFIGSRIALLAESGDSMTGLDRFINYASMLVFGGVGAAVALLVYRRTMARAAELGGDVESGDALFDGTPLGEDDDEDEEMEQGVVGRGSGDDGGRMVHPDELDAAALMDDDDISLWETEGGDGYHDSWDDEPAKTTTGINGSRR